MTGGQRSGLRVHGRAIRQRRAAADERGFTLVEILIAVILLGTMTTAMIGALYTVGFVSSQQRAISVAEAEGRRLVEQLRALSYVTCSADDDAEDRTRRYPLVFSPGNSENGLVSARITDIDYWSGQLVESAAGSNASTQPEWKSDCLSTPDCGLQRITLWVKASDSTATFTFLKRADFVLTGACLT